MIVPVDPKILSILKLYERDKKIPLPYSKEIFLLECNIAGTSFLDLEEIEPGLKKGDLLIFKREIDNPVDELAILILNEKGLKLGYVPRVKNEVLARLMDAGKLIFGKLEDKSRVEEWLKLDIRVFLKDL
ncbi:MAG: HIRAN domain-containing protein [Acidobacteriota bacterium]